MSLLWNFSKIECLSHFSIFIENLVNKNEKIRIKMLGFLKNHLIKELF